MDKICKFTKPGRALVHAAKNHHPAHPFRKKGGLTIKGLRNDISYRNELITLGIEALKKGHDTVAWDHAAQSVSGLNYNIRLSQDRFIKSDQNRAKRLKELANKDLIKFLPIMLFEDAKFVLALRNRFNLPGKSFNELVKESITNTDLQKELNIALHQIIEPLLKKIKATGIISVKQSILGHAMLSEVDRGAKLTYKVDDIINFSKSIEPGKSDLYSYVKGQIIDYPSLKDQELLKSLGLDPSLLETFNGSTFETWGKTDNSEVIIDPETLLTGEHISKVVELAEGIRSANERRLFLSSTSPVHITTKKKTASSEPQTDSSGTSSTTENSPPPLTLQDIENGKAALKGFFSKLIETPANITDVQIACDKALALLGPRHKELLKKIGVFSETLIAAIYSLKFQNDGIVPTIEQITRNNTIKGHARDHFLDQLDLLNQLCGNKIFYTDVTHSNINKTDEKVLKAYREVLIKNSDSKSFMYDTVSKELFKALKDDALGEKEAVYRLSKFGINQELHEIFFAYWQAIKENPDEETLGERIREKLAGKVDLSNITDMKTYIDLRRSAYTEVFDLKGVELTPAGKTPKLSPKSELSGIKSVIYPDIVRNIYILAKFLGVEVKEGELPNKDAMRRTYTKFKRSPISQELQEAYKLYPCSHVPEVTIRLVFKDNNEEKSISVPLRELEEKYLKQFPIFSKKLNLD